MGCWNETCVITNTPIMAGDPAVMVIFDSKITEEHEMFCGIRQNLIGVYHGTYDDYGCLDELKGDQVPFPSDFDEGRHGKYSFFFAHEHAWTKVVEFVQKQLAEPDEYVGREYKQILKYYEQHTRIELHSEVIAEALSSHKKDPSVPWSELAPKPIYAPGQEETTKELLYVLDFLRGCRRNPWIGDEFRGCQSVGLEENRLILELAKQALDEYELATKD